MTRRPLPDATFKYVLVPTAWGWSGLLRTERGLRKVTLPRASQEEVLALLAPGAAQPDADAFGDLPHRLQAYFSGQPVAFPCELDLSGSTPFQEAVWMGLRTVEYGEARTYGWLAEHVGTPAGARAVGQAVGANPMPIVIPCHRIVAAHGGMGGWSGGDIGEKARLLEMERAGTSGGV